MVSSGAAISTLIAEIASFGWLGTIPTKKAEDFGRVFCVDKRFLHVYTSPLITTFRNFEISFAARSKLFIFKGLRRENFSRKRQKPLDKCGFFGYTICISVGGNPLKIRRLEREKVQKKTENRLTKWIFRLYYL